MHLLTVGGGGQRTGGGGGGISSSSQYYSLANLKGNSTAIAWGNVSGLVTVYGNATIPIIHSVFTFNIIKYVKGSGPTTIDVDDSGGVLGSITDADPASPLLISGGSYVLFLFNNWIPCPSSPRPAACIIPPTPLSTTFGIVDGPQGKFLVQNGLVYGFKTLYPADDYYLAFDANGVPISQFLSQVSS